ncbi:DNA-binding domain-containing protein [Priestia filamentosa]|uniref:DNA-binding domain-containing protein n=1 Tax=Priestia filamentosa TaxID=1402861 RepID=UPI001F32E7AF|nr:DNA-binding domain-containing protein [Priestia filamentosa]
MTDYTIPKFKAYSSTFFTFSEVRKKVLNLENKSAKTSNQSCINMKKFIQTLIMEARQLVE